MIDALTDLNRILDRSTRLFADALHRVARATFLDTRDWDTAQANLADLMRHTLILSDLHGRKRMLMQADHVRRNRTAKFAAVEDATPIDPGVPFQEAIDDLVTREPRLAQSAEEVARLYNTDHAFAMARSASQKLTERVQEIVTNLIREGKAAVETEAEILEAAVEESHNWSRAYAATVYRTNANTAYQQGRMEQARDPDVYAVLPALEYVGVDDAAVRPNHRAAFGLIADVEDPIWRTFHPPLGYQCRCGLESVSVYALESRGLIRDGRVLRYEPPGFQNARPDGPPFSAGRRMP